MKIEVKDVYQMRLAGALGIMIPDFTAVEVGEKFTIGNEDYLIVDKQSLSRYTDGVYAGRPAWIQLRGFNPDNL
jgi:hypothetical protein